MSGASCKQALSSSPMNAASVSLFPRKLSRFPLISLFFKIHLRVFLLLLLSCFFSIARRICGRKRYLLVNSDLISRRPWTKQIHILIVIKLISAFVGRLLVMRWLWGIKGKLIWKALIIFPSFWLWIGLYLLLEANVHIWLQRVRMIWASSLQRIQKCTRRCWAH